MFKIDIEIKNPNDTLLQYKQVTSGSSEANFFYMRLKLDIGKSQG